MPKIKLNKLLTLPGHCALEYVIESVTSANSCINDDLLKFFENIIKAITYIETNRHTKILIFFLNKYQIEAQDSSVSHRKYIHKHNRISQF